MLALEDILRDPPQVHVGSRAPSGVWRTEDSCYRFLVEHCGPDSHTLETGCGISTAVFAVLGTDHTCVVASEYEVGVLRAYLSERGVSQERLTFQIGSSDVVLPNLRPLELDLLFIDGCHGFPFPILDWYYAGRWLRCGGYVVVDDLQLPSVGNTLAVYLEQDPRWIREPLQGTWAAYRRESDGPLAEEWTDQRFLGEPDAMRQLLRDVMLR